MSKKLDELTKRFDELTNGGCKTKKEVVEREKIRVQIMALSYSIKPTKSYIAPITKETLDNFGVECECCKGVFMQRNVRQKYCCHECRKKANTKKPYKRTIEDKLFVNGIKSDIKNIMECDIYCILDEFGDIE